MPENRHMLIPARYTAENNAGAGSIASRYAACPVALVEANPFLARSASPPCRLKGTHRAEILSQVEDNSQDNGDELATRGGCNEIFVSRSYTCPCFVSHAYLMHPLMPREHAIQAIEIIACILALDLLLDRRRLE